MPAGFALRHFMAFSSHWRQSSPFPPSPSPSIHEQELPSAAGLGFCTEAAHHWQPAPAGEWKMPLRILHVLAHGVSWQKSSQ